MNYFAEAVPGPGRQAGTEETLALPAGAQIIMFGPRADLIRKRAPQ